MSLLGSGLGFCESGDSGSVDTFSLADSLVHLTFVSLGSRSLGFHVTFIKFGSSENSFSFDKSLQSSSDQIALLMVSILLDTLSSANKAILVSSRSSGFSLFRSKMSESFCG